MDSTAKKHLLPYRGDIYIFVESIDIHLQKNIRKDLEFLEFMERLNNITPGEILLEEFLVPLGISQYRLAKELNIPQTRISGIINSSRRITADTALRLSLFFGNSAKFWLGLHK